MATDRARMMGHQAIQYLGGLLWKRVGLELQLRKIPGGRSRRGVVMMTWRNTFAFACCEVMNLKRIEHMDAHCEDETGLS
jgi:hypothetical protein